MIIVTSIDIYIHIDTSVLFFLIYLLLCTVYYYCYYQHCCIFIHLPICDGLYVDWCKKGIAIPRGYAAYANDFLLLILSHSHTSMPMLPVLYKACILTMYHAPHMNKYDIHIQ